MATDALTTEEIPALFEAWADGLYRYAWSLCNDSDEAEDLVQTAFLRFVEQVGKGLVRRATAEHYLTRTIRNLNIDRHRRGRHVTGIERIEDIPARAGQADEALEARLVYSILSECANDPELDRDVRRVIQMRFIEQRDAAAIVAETGRSRSAVYRLMERAVRHLSERFAAEGIHLEDLD